jgi:hypothetical protein
LRRAPGTSSYQSALAWYEMNDNEKDCIRSAQAGKLGGHTGGVSIADTIR